MWPVEAKESYLNKSSNDSDDANRNQPSVRAAEQPNAVPVYLVQMPPDPADSQDDLYRFWRFIWGFRRLIATFTLLAAIPSILYAVMAEPKYRSEIVVAPIQAADQQGGLEALASQFGGVASLVGLNFGGGAQKDQAIAVLKSRAFTEQFFQDYDIVPLLFSEDWDEVNGRWSLDSADDFPTLSDAYKKFDQDVRSIREDSITGLVTLSIDWVDREVAAEWANILVNRLNENLRQAAIEDATTNIDYLNAELERSSGIGLRQAIYNLIEQQIEIVMIANTRREFAFKVLDPAVPADIDDYVWPLRLVIVIFGVAVGFLAGIGVALVLSASRSQKRGLAVSGDEHNRL
tara:strand:- start:29000 stop:30040 length:1041 start_codon:yes stop_codon:yes gene_type:complete